MTRDLEAQAAFIAAREAMPFVWGSTDCVTFAAGAVLALTGTDPLIGIGTWKSERGALLALKRRGGLLAAVSSVLPDTPIAATMRGDIGAVMSPLGPLLMVIEGMTLVGPDIDGIKRLPRSALVQAWSAAL